jgi:Flp pilus assembly protein CpaB
MKNYIPLVLAVLLGLAAVLAVTRMIAKNRQAPEDMAWVLAAQRDLEKDKTLNVDSVFKKEIPVSARPADSIVWSMRQTIEGQVLNRAIRSGDYILLSDLRLSRTMADSLGEGEWGVTINVGNTGIGRVIQPGDEVAIIATFSLEMSVATADQSKPPQKVSKEATLVLFPRVRVLESTANVGRGEGGGEVIVALRPQDAQTLIAAQRKAQITLALRRATDSAALNRLEAGMVDESTFEQLLKGVEPVKVPTGVKESGAKKAP